MKTETGILGVVLAGGQSRRMGSVDKTLMPLCGVPMVKIVLDRIRPQVDDVIVNSNADASLFAAFGAPVLCDTVAGYAGPLAGILTALEYAAENDFQSVCSVAADTPFFPHDFVTKLTDLQDHDVILASYNGFRQPTFGLWSVGLIDRLRAFLTQGDERKIMRFVQQQNWAIVEFDSNPIDGADPFFNVNTPDDMKLAEQYLGNYETDHA
ncbi:MAG: molybdenum cofactor guanylyltransferase MobA [Hyphomicrobiales bacterium]